MPFICMQSLGPQVDWYHLLYSDDEELLLLQTRTRWEQHIGTLT